MNLTTNQLTSMPLRLLTNDVFAAVAWSTSAGVAIINTFSDINFSPFITAITLIVGIAAAFFKGKTYYYESKIKEMTYKDMKEEHDAEDAKQNK